MLSIRCYAPLSELVNAVVVGTMHECEAASVGTEAAERLEQAAQRIREACKSCEQKENEGEKKV